MHRAETRVMVNERLNRRPASEAERQYGEAWRYEQMGDRLTAWQKYDALIQLFQKSELPDDQAFVRLAGRQIEQIKTNQGNADTQAVFVQKQLERAKMLASTGDLIQARRSGNEPTRTGHQTFHGRLSSPNKTGGRSPPS